MQKLENRSIDKKNEQLEHWIRMLLPPERFEQSVKLQPIKEKEKKSSSSTKTLNPIGQSNHVKQTRLSEENSILLKQVINANQKDNLFTNICAYLKDPTMHAKSEDVKLKGCRVSKDLLIKENQLWVSDHKDLRLEILKKIHNQPAVSHPGVERILNMIRRHYYWLHMQQTIEQYI